MAIHPEDTSTADEGERLSAREDGSVVVECDLDAVDEPSASVVEAVATAIAVDPLDLLAPLSEAVDPDALDDLFTTDRDATGRVWFSFAGTTVEVRTDGTVTVTPDAS